ncbi:MAG: hypothetical protein ACI8P9_000696 [Parasphingorhabdus sp.]|jgi:hypothetical protein
MSYILDALKKSDEERAVGNIQTLDSLSVESNSPSQRVVIILISLVVILLLALGLVVWWFSDTLQIYNFDTLSTPTQSQMLEQGQQSGVIDSTRLVDVESGQPEKQSELPLPSVESSNLSNTLQAPVSIAGLDQSVRKLLPDFSVDVLSYSSSLDRRFVMLNQEIYKEGDLMADNLIVEKIEPNRIVLSISGNHFYILP